MKIISGGQTGVDRAALDVALALGLECGGWCPRGRKAEDGRIPDRYPLRETPLVAYRQRTCWNIAEADGTLILTPDGKGGRGTELTRREARKQNKWTLDLALTDGFRCNALSFTDWIDALPRRPTINVAGPRESTAPGVYNAAAEFLRAVLRP